MNEAGRASVPGSRASALGAGAQCAAMGAASLLALRPLLGEGGLWAVQELLSGASIVAALLSALLAARASLEEPAPALKTSSVDSNPPPANRDSNPLVDPRHAVLAGRLPRRLRFTAQLVAALSALVSLWAHARISFEQDQPAVGWFALLGAVAIAAWACMHLRASLIRARFFWALGVGLLLTVFSAMERPDAFARLPPGPQRFEPGSQVNLVLGVGALLLGEGHPGAELFAVAAMYAPSSSAVEPRTPWFRHLAAVASALLASLLVFGLRHAKLGLRGVARAATGFALLAALLIALPHWISPLNLESLDGAALWLLAAGAAIFAREKESQI